MIRLASTLGLGGGGGRALGNGHSASGIYSEFFVGEMAGSMVFRSPQAASGHD